MPFVLSATEPRQSPRGRRCLAWTTNFLTVGVLGREQSGTLLGVGTYEGEPGLAAVACLSAGHTEDPGPLRQRCSVD